MRIALDTNRYTDLVRGDADTVSTAETAEAMFLPLIVLGELRCHEIHTGRGNLCGRVAENASCLFLPGGLKGLFWRINDDLSRGAFAPDGHGCRRVPLSSVKSILGVPKL